MPREDVVTTVDVLAIDREATTGNDGEDSFDNKHGCDVTTLLCTLIGGVSLGEYGDTHGDSPVVVEDAEDEPDSAENDQAVLVKQHHHPRHGGGHDQEDLTHVQARMPVRDGIKNNIRKRFSVRNLVMGEGQTEGGRDKPTRQEKGAEECFQIFIACETTFSFGHNGKRKVGILSPFCSIFFAWAAGGQDQRRKLEENQMIEDEHLSYSEINDILTE